MSLVRATIEDAEVIWKMQVEAFADLLAKYQDPDTNPGSELIEKVIGRLEQPDTYFYLIQLNDEIVGAIRVVDAKDESMKKESLHYSYYHRIEIKVLHKEQYLK